MEGFFTLKDKLYSLYIKANNKEDSAENLVIDGSKDIEVLLAAKELFEASLSLGVEDSITFTIDDEYVNKEELENFIDNDFSFTRWSLVASKIGISESMKDRGSRSSVVFFFDNNSYSSWLLSIDPLRAKNNIFVCSSSVLVLAPGIKKGFGGPRLAVIPIESKSMPSTWPSTDSLPSEDTIREHVHLVPSEPIRLSPRSFSLSWGDISSKDAEPYRMASALSLASSLADVIYGSHCIVLKGVRHLELPLCAESDSAPSSDFIVMLQSALEWVYEERVDTRKKLLADRLCLEAVNERSLLPLLVAHLSDAVKQSKDQYRFVILDRKDEYAKELRELLKDLRNQSDLYAQKVRGLIAGLLRDSLAAFVFVALSLSSRLGSKIDVLMSDAGVIFFKALGVYFIMSGILQTSSSIKDLFLSDRELEKWSEVTKEYIPKQELKNRIKDDLSGRRNTFWFYAILIFIFYLVLGYCSWNMSWLVELVFTGFVSEAGTDGVVK